MARRTVRIQSDIRITLDDHHDGIPPSDEVMARIFEGVAQIKGVVAIEGGAKFMIGLDRASLAEMKRRNRVVRANRR